MPEDVSVSGNLGTYYYIFNTKKKPFDDVGVRKAISYAIDVFDALTSKRPYKEPWSIEQTIEHMQHRAGR